MSNFVSQVQKVDPFFLGGLFGGDNSDTPQLPPPPDFKPDPNYTSQINFLQPYSMGLLSGNNIPDFYKSIGTQNSPEFQAALGVSNKQIGQSAAEAAAMAGTGRGGQLPQVTAQQVGDNTAKLTYADFLNSNAGKQFLMTQGENVSKDVLAGALNNQQQVNSYDLNAYNAAIGTDKANIGYQQQASAQLGSMLGTILPAAATIGGGIIGGPAGAEIGAQVGSALGGNTSSIADLFKLGGNTGSAAPASSNTNADSGSSTIGAIQDPNYLMKYFNLQ